MFWRDENFNSSKIIVSTVFDDLNSDDDDDANDLHGLNGFKWF